MATSRLGLGKNWAFTLPLFFLLFLNNAFLVSPYIGWYDTGEMTGVTACLGISHPSGQVLFHLLGKIFLLLPFQTPAFRLGLLSVTCSALASVLFFLLACKLAEAVGGDKLKGPPGLLRVWLLLLALAWSLSLPWWRYSLMPLVYALHLLLALLVLWALSLDKPFRWMLVFFLLGISTVFRPTQFFALPFVGLAFLHHLWKGRKGNGGNSIPLKAAFLNLVLFILGRSTALYLPLRSALHPPIAFADLTHPLALFRHVFALKFSGYVGTVTSATVLSVLTQMLTHFWKDLSPIGVLLIAAGLWSGLKRKEKLPLFLWVALGWGSLEALFVFTIPYPTFESHQALLGWAFSGLWGTLALGRFWERAQGEGFWRGMALFILVFFVGLQLSGYKHMMGRKNDRGAQDYARNLLEIMEPGSVYYPAEENEYFPVVGYQESFGFRKDVTLLPPGESPSVVGGVIRQCLEQGRSLCVTRKWALQPGWAYESVGPLLKIIPVKPDEGPARVSRHNAPIAQWGKIALGQVAVAPAQVQAGGRIEITYPWQRSGASPCDETSTVIALFADDAGNYWTQNGAFWLHDIHEGPMGRPSEMKPGYEYAEKRILFIPSDFPPGHYHLVVGLQKLSAVRMEGNESYGKEFYERSGYQSLDKFMGRGDRGAVVQFSPDSSATVGNDLWPVTKCARSAADPRFAIVADLDIQE